MLTQEQTNEIDKKELKRISRMLDRYQSKTVINNLPTSDPDTICQYIQVILYELNYISQNAINTNCVIDEHSPSFIGRLHAAYDVLNDLSSDMNKEVFRRYNSLLDEIEDFKKECEEYDANIGTN